MDDSVALNIMFMFPLALVGLGLLIQLQPVTKIIYTFVKRILSHIYYYYRLAVSFILPRIMLVASIVRFIYITIIKFIINIYRKSKRAFVAFYHATSDAISKVAWAIRNALKEAFDVLNTVFAAARDFLYDLARNLLNIYNTIKAAVLPVVRQINDFFNTFRQTISPAIDAIVSVVKTIVEVLFAIFSPLLIVLGLLKKVLKTFSFF